MTFTTVALTFFFYGFSGWLLEVCYMFFEQRRFVNRGFLAGPICPMYGVGMVLMAAALSPLRQSAVLLFLGALLLSSALEFAVGGLLELVFKTRWWDYSDRRFNLMGHICLEFSLAWGVVAFLALRFVHPHVERAIASIPQAGRNALSAILLTVFSVDAIISVTAALRLTKRLATLQELLSRVISESGLADGLHRQREELAEAAERLSCRITVWQRRLLMAYPRAASKRFSDAMGTVKRSLRRRSPEKAGSVDK